MAIDADSIDTLTKIFGGAAVAALSAFVSGVLKRRRDRLKTIRSLAREIYQVRDQLRANFELLDADDAAAVQGQEVVRYLSPIVTPAASAAASSGALAGTSVDVWVWHVQGMTVIVNNAEAGREMYRHTNAAMDNFSSRRPMINEEIRRDSIALATSLDQLEVGLLRFSWWNGVRDKDLEGLQPALREKRRQTHSFWRIIWRWR